MNEITYNDPQVILWYKQIDAVIPADTDNKVRNNIYKVLLNIAQTCYDRTYAIELISRVLGEQELFSLPSGKKEKRNKGVKGKAKKQR